MRVAKLTYIKGSSVKAQAKMVGKRVSKQFLAYLDIHVAKKIETALKFHNAGKKTLDDDCAVYVSIV